MTQDDYDEFTRTMTKLAAAFGTKTNSDQVDAYFLAMKPFSLMDMDRACQTAIETSAFFPKAAELREWARVPERFNDDERTYACLRCYDKAVVLTERKDREGRRLGTFACPCDCAAGVSLRASWEKPDAKGHVVADEAKRNTEKLRKAGAL